MKKKKKKKKIKWSALGPRKSKALFTQPELDDLSDLIQGRKPDREK